MWNKRTLIGINKAVTILNPPPDMADEQAVRDFYNFPLELLEGDFVGFNAISDPFWPKYRKELDYFMANVPQIAKLVTCVTKMNPPDSVLTKLALIPNFRLVVSITGLDTLENMKTTDRLDLLKRAKDLGIKAFPLCHPYISGMSDLSFLKELKNLGYEYIDVKGLRYNDETMRTWMPEKSRFLYIGKGDQENLVEDGWREKIKESGLELLSLKKWYQKDHSLTPSLSYEEAARKVDKLLEIANITSSDTDSAVIEAAIGRRL